MAFVVFGQMMSPFTSVVVMQFALNTESFQKDHVINSIQNKSHSRWDAVDL